MDGSTQLCHHSPIAERPTFADVRARFAKLRDPTASPNQGAPVGAATPGQIGAMRQTMELLKDPRTLMLVRNGRQAVAGDDVVALAEIPGCPAPAPGDWSLRVTGPIARELADSDGPSADVIRAQLGALAAAPTELGQALGMGLAGVWLASGESHRLLYALHESERLVTVLSVEYA